MKGNQKMKHIWIVAQADSNQTPTPITSEPLTKEETSPTTTTVSDANAPAAKKTPRGFMDNPTQLIFIALIFVMMYMILFRGPRKKQQKHKQMVQSLQKNDRVRTIGGILGTVVDVKGDEVTLKIDESNNTKIKIATSAVGRNLSQNKD